MKRFLSARLASADGGRPRDIQAPADRKAPRIRTGRLARGQAIRPHTVNGACLNREEKEKGSLEAGKDGDLVVIDRDVLTRPAKDVRAPLTVGGGKVVFERKKCAAAPGWLGR